MEQKRTSFLISTKPLLRKIVLKPALNSNYIRLAINENSDLKYLAKNLQILSHVSSSRKGLFCQRCMMLLAKGYLNNFTITKPIIKIFWNTHEKQRSFEKCQKKQIEKKSEKQKKEKSVMS